jgi:hypothetical protein
MTKTGPGLWLLAMFATRVFGASTPDTWIDAFANTGVACDSRIIKSGMTREESIRATLAAVRAQRPGLDDLEMVMSPPSLGAEKLETARAPGLTLPAIDALYALAGTGVRIEITDRQLRLLKVDDGAEGVRRAIEEQKQRSFVIAALEAGHADAAVLDRAGRILQRPREVATGGIGYAGMVPLTLAAFEIVRRAPDAVQRFQAIERVATREGKIYARAGLFVSGGRVILRVLPPLDGEVFAMSGCIGTREAARSYFEGHVLSGEFTREIEATVKSERERSPEFAARMAAGLESMRRDLSSPAPPTIGRVIDDELVRRMEWDILVREK